MINILQEKLAKITGNELEKFNFLREYLQLLVLKIIDEEDYFRNLAFVGGTALRILYDLDRFSEDLDFCQTDRSFPFSDMINKIETRLQQNNLNIKISHKTNNTVAVAMIRFSDLLFDLHLSPLKEQKILIKLEMDQNPPNGYKTQFTMINKEFLVGINHYDLPSLFASKLHAILCRKYTKGRDFYDLMWYLSKKIEPNYLLLENAIKQTESESITLNKISLITLLRKKIESTDFDRVKNDVFPFLRDQKQARFFHKDIFSQMLN